MIQDIFIGFSEIFGYGIMISFILMIFVLVFIFSRGIGMIAGTVGFLSMLYLAWYYPVIEVPLINQGLVIGAFIIFGLFLGSLIYLAISRN